MFVILLSLLLLLILILFKYLFALLRKLLCHAVKLLVNTRDHEVFNAIHHLTDLHLEKLW